MIPELENLQKDIDNLQKDIKTYQYLLYLRFVLSFVLGFVGWVVIYVCFFNK